MYSTTWCPHCQWVKSAFEEVALKYQSEGKIVAKHWELDIKDDTLTPEVEGSVPSNEQGIFSQFSPKGSVPVFVFGCKYYRIANQFETQKDLNAEKAEFERIINLLLK
jgi:thiol-disulfide isomerase/thioredoxin